MIRLLQDFSVHDAGCHYKETIFPPDSYSGLDLYFQTGRVDSQMYLFNFDVWNGKHIETNADTHEPIQPVPIYFFTMLW